MGEETSSFAALLDLKKLTLDEIEEPATALVQYLVGHCQAFVSSKAQEGTERDSWTTEDQDEHDDVLAICWGLVAIDPHYSPFLKLLDSALALDAPPTTWAQLAQDLPKLQGETSLEQAEYLVDLAVSEDSESEVPPGVLMMEAARLFHTAAGDRWRWRKTLSHRHLLALRRARERFGYDFMGHLLGSLVTKALLALAWSKPPVEDPDWCNACAEILHLRYGGRSEDDPDRAECLREPPLPPELGRLFRERELLMKRVDKDCAVEEEESVPAVSPTSRKPDDPGEEETSEKTGPAKGLDRVPQLNPVRQLLLPAPAPRNFSATAASFHPFKQPQPIGARQAAVVDEKEAPPVPLPAAQLDSFALPSGTWLQGAQLAKVTFASTLGTFDAPAFRTDYEGLRLLTQKLAGVEKIRAIRVSEFGRFGGYRSTRLLDCFPSTVWKYVEVLEVDEEQLRVIGEHLNGSTRLRCLICPGSDPTGLELPSLKFLRLGNGTRDNVDFVQKLKAAFPSSVTVELEGRRFQLDKVSVWREARGLPYSTMHDPFLEWEDASFNQSGRRLFQPDLAYLPDFRGHAEVRLGREESRASALRDWCCSSQFEEDSRRKDELGKIRVAVLDSGVDPTHPDLGSAVRDVANFVPGESFIDLLGHGTHCAGIIAGAKYGVAPGVQLFVGKVLNRHGEGNPDWIAKGVEWAIKQDVQIISLSLGMPTYHQGLHDAILKALSRGIIVVCAAGNDGSRYRFNVKFPATIAGAIRVGSIDHTGASSSFSSVGGPQIDAVAVGERVVSTNLCMVFQDPRYNVLSGTSMATSVLTAICAMLLAYDASLFGEDRKIRNAHCMKDVLGKLCFNSSQVAANGRGSPDLAHIFRVPAAFIDHLNHIC